MKLFHSASGWLELGVSRRSIALWLTISLLFTLYYGLVSIAYAFHTLYIVQDDVRQHIVWMQRFTDPDLFPSDYIAHYFQTVASAGFKAVYAGAAKLGFAPLVFVKILPLLLGLITTVYLFYAFLELFPSAIGAFLSTLILNQLLWLNDDLITGTPRAFVYPIFAAFLYYFLRGSIVPCLVAIALQGLFYPQIMLVQLGAITLGLVQRNGKRLSLSKNRRDYRFWAAAVCVALLVIVPFRSSMASLGDPVSAAQMRSMPEFGFLGRTEYFGVPPLNFWFNGNSGLRVQLFPSVSLLGFVLPLMGRYRSGSASRPAELIRTGSRFPALKHLDSKARVLADVLIASLIWFTLAHIFLPDLHLPSRYNYHSFRMVLPLSAAIVLTVLLIPAWQTLRLKLRGNSLSGGDRLKLIIVGLIAAIAILVPLVPPLIFTLQNWRTAQTPAVHQFLAAQPKSALVASLAEEADNVPAFALRSTLVGREFALPYHPSYYQQVQQRAIDLLQLHYSLDPQIMRQVIDRYGIDWIWIEDDAFTPNYLRLKDSTLR